MAEKTVNRGDLGRIISDDKIEMRAMMIRAMINAIKQSRTQVHMLLAIRLVC